jgi:phosphonate transport system substrate-binding protein
VELVTGSSYQTALDDLDHNKVDVAILGSLVTVLAVDRYDAQVMLKTDLLEGGSEYAGVICVREDSPVRDVEDLAGKRVALVRATMAGNLFPVADFIHREMMDGENAPKTIWVGTHDDAVLAMVEGMVDAAAVKDARLDAWARAHPSARVRILAQSPEVPESSIVARAGVAKALREQVAQALLKMEESDAGRATLREYGAVRFLPCSIDEFQPVYDLVTQMGSSWEKLGVPGKPPKPRKSSQPEGAN